jgi:hypothetical protein
MPATVRGGVGTTRRSWRTRRARSPGCAAAGDTEGFVSLLTEILCTQHRDHVETSVTFSANYESSPLLSDNLRVRIGESRRLWKLVPCRE